MEGNEKLTLFCPEDKRQDEYGQQKNVYKEIKVYARRQDRGGRETGYADTLGGQWQTRFEIRATPSVLKANEEWFVEDSYGVRYNIESVIFAPFWGGRRFMYLLCVRTTAR